MHESHKNLNSSHVNQKGTIEGLNKELDKENNFRDLKIYSFKCPCF